MRKRIKKYNNGGFSGLIQGATQGAPLGLPGMIIGGGLGYLQGAAAGNAQEEAMRIDEEKRKLSEEQRAIEERNAAVAQNQAILDAFPVQGTTTPRFDKGGETDPPKIDWPARMEGYNRVREQLPLKHTGKLFQGAKGMDPLLQEIGKMTEEEYKTFSQKVQGIVGSAQQMQADGKTSFGEGIDFMRNLDASFLRPLREQSGMSKGEVIDTVMGNLGQDLSWGERTAIKGAALLKDFENGGDTDPPYNGPTATPESVMQYQNPQIRQWHPSRLDLLREAFYNHNMQEDGTFENMAEMVDPTGISSWDDAYRANQLPNRPYTADQTLDTVGAMPIFGKAKVGLNLGKGALHAFKHGMKQSGSDLLNFAKQASNYLNVADGVEDEIGFLNGYAMGGATAGPGYEVEGGEMMQTNGEQPRVYGQGGMSQVSSNEFEVKGPKHSGGGVKASDNNGARVYSDKLKADPSLVAKLMKL